MTLETDLLFLDSTCFTSLVVTVFGLFSWLENISHIQGRTQAEGKGGPGPPWVQNFFFLVYKIFIKKAWAPWFLAWAPLTSPIPIPASQPKSFQEPMKTLKYIYICVIKNKKKNKKKKKT